MSAVAEFFEQMKGIDAEKTKGINATYQWDITGDDGGTWHAVFNDDGATVAEGAADSPNITITVASEDWLKIVSGELNGQMAFMTGKLKIQGDMSLAMKLQQLTG